MVLRVLAFAVHLVLLGSLGRALSQEDPGPGSEQPLLGGPLFLRINEDPPVDKSSAAGHDRVLVKTRLCRDRGEWSFCGRPSNTTYPLPATHSVRTIDNHAPFPETAMYCAPHGIAGYADWVYVSHPVGLFGSTLLPRVIYVHTKLLDDFAEKVLPFVPRSFVLVSSCNDYTIPFNVDLRYGFGQLMHLSAWKRLVTSHRVLHWFAENRYWTHPKVSTLPIGASMAMDEPDYRGYPDTLLPLEKRSPRIIVTDKIHGPEAQWNDRRALAKACRQRPEVCVSIGTLVSHEEWALRVSRHQFIACGHGGGLDPSPKAWESIKIGTIPIVEESPLVDAYGQLPIAWVRDLKAFLLWDNVSVVLNTWLQDLGPYYEMNSVLRNETLNRLKGRYWYDLVREKLD